MRNYALWESTFLYALHVRVVSDKKKILFFDWPK